MRWDGRSPTEKPTFSRCSRVEERKIIGISYRLQDFKIKGCKLHQASFSQLLEHRVTYDPQKDMLAISQANDNETIELEPELEVSWNQAKSEDYVPSKVKQLLEITSELQEMHTVRKSVVIEHNREFEIEF